MPRTIRLPRAILLVLLLPLLFQPQALRAQWPPVTSASLDSPQIAAVGTGLVRSAPDYAVVFLNVRSSSAGGAEGLSEIAVQTRTLNAALEGAGLDSSDISLWGLAVGDGTMNGMGQVTTAATQGLRFVVRDLDRLGELVELALLSGASGLSAVIFALDHNPDLLQSATRAAYEVAHQKAQGLAAAAGGRLGDPISIQNVTDYADMSASELILGMGMGGQLSPQDVGVRASVQATWEFIPR